MAIDPKDLGELQRALNDAAGKASALWTTFIVFQLYLAIAFGSVTHRDLFLETSIKLPLLNVDLPLVGFFVVAPTVLLIFHFYVFLQVTGLASKAKDYNTLLAVDTPVASDRQYIRQRLDIFPILQFLAGPRDQRTGFTGFSLRLITWITLAATPVLLLLQGQVTFLPYHHERIVWLQRITVLIDLAVVWYFWARLSSDNDPVGWLWRKAKICLGGATTFCVLIFSVYLATFPGEWVKMHLPELRYIPTTFKARISLQALLFEGDVDEVSGRPISVFSNRLVLNNQSVVDAEKLDKVVVSRSFRGRDLRLVVLARADLRKADFTGAQLQGASLDGAQLQGASFQHAELQSASLDGAQLQGVSLDGAQLQDASLEGAQLQGASFQGAQLEGSSLDGAELQGASFVNAQLRGSSLDGAQLQGASFHSAQLQGASLDGAQLQGASFHSAQLQGASLDGAQLQGASFFQAQLQGASLHRGQLQGALFEDAQLQGASFHDEGLPSSWNQTVRLELASLRSAMVWHARVVRRDMSMKLTDLTDIDQETVPWGNTSFTHWRDAILEMIPREGLGRNRTPRRSASERLSTLDQAASRVSADTQFWNEALSATPLDEERDKQLATFLADLGCARDAAPYVTRGLLWNARLHLQRAEAGTSRFQPVVLQIIAIAERLRKGKSDPSNCPAVRGFTEKDWSKLDELVVGVGPPPDEKAN
jgi:uncharacterized protein YjbI with pentapeptide repeats